MPSPRLEPPPPRERGLWELLPRRNFRRALLLLFALLGILAIKRSGGATFRGLVDAVAPPPPPVLRHLEVKPPPTRAPSVDRP